MRQSLSLIRTYREAPSDAETKSHKLLVKGGYIRQLSSGVYTFLPLGWRVLNKIINIIREEMNAIGAQELFMPSLTPSSLWKESGRWESFGEDMFRLKDRKGREYALAPTHEEVISEIAREYIKSYKDLPQIWYQIQTKFRDEPRPRGGILRVREFIMKDSYSLDASWEGLEESYALHREAYKRIFSRCGLKFVHVKASSGLMGGKESEEFMVLSDAGEDKLAICENCGWAANVEVAPVVDRGERVVLNYRTSQTVHTPGARTVEEVCAQLGIEPKYIVKSLLYITKEGPVMVLIRGDHEVNENKLASILREPRLATSEEIKEILGVDVGFIGPVDVKIRKVADNAVRNMEGFVVGANMPDHHIVGVSLEDIGDVEFYDIRMVSKGDICPNCGEEINIRNAIEVGHIFKLGTRYSESMGVYFTDRDGERKPVIMGSYGIGPGRIMASAVELYGTENSMIWPKSISPFDVHIIDLIMEGDEIYDGLTSAGFDVLWDDRQESAGVKFHDAELIGIPIRVVIGKHWAEDKVEVQDLIRGEVKIVHKANLINLLKEVRNSC